MFSIALSTENGGGKLDKYDCIITTSIKAHFKMGATLYWPLASRQFYNNDRSDHTLQDLMTISTPIDAAAELQRKTGFAVMTQFKCDQGMYGPHASTRIALFDVLAETYKPALALSKCRHNQTLINNFHRRGKDGDGKRHLLDTPKPKVKPEVRSSEAALLDGAVKLWAPFKFVIAFENSFEVIFPSTVASTVASDISCARLS
jgi:hypothetical protein